MPSGGLVACHRWRELAEPVEGKGVALAP
jgi:hypothetical protein